MLHNVPPTDGWHTMGFDKLFSVQRSSKLSKIFAGNFLSYSENRISVFEEPYLYQKTSVITELIFFL